MSKKRSKVSEDRLSTFFLKLSEDLVNSPNPSSRSAVERQLSRMRKRAEFYKPELETKAITDFISVNDLVSLRNDPELYDKQLFRDMKDFIRHVLEKFVKSYDPDSLQECISLSYIIDNWAFGPGASNGVRGTGTVQKIDSHMTCTVSAETIVRLIRKTNLYMLAIDSKRADDGLLTVDGSRLTTVLKNEDAVRTIAIEPSGNMAVQLAGGRLIEGSLRMLGLDIRNQQEMNKLLARRYSINDRGATIDLKSASDMFSIEFVRAVWPEEWFDFFMRYRSPITTLPDGSKLNLNMISTMGNGFTFPMMTLTLVALIYAVRLANGGPFRFIDLKGTAVFGDDIIIPSSEFDQVVSALHDCGLIVNINKSYSSGPFRESCGGDYYEGVDITPFYVRRLSHISSIYVAINQLLLWSSRHEVPVVRSLSYLFGLVGSEVYFIPEWLDDFSGVKCSQLPRNYKYLGLKPRYLTYNGHFSMPLAAGGYLLSMANGARYSPRDNRVQYRSRKARLPSGYLDGWDPRYRTQRQSAYAQLMVELVK